MRSNPDHADTINGIPRVDLPHRPVWKRQSAWWTGGRWMASTTALSLWRKFIAPIDAPVMKASGGRLRFSIGIPIVVLTSTGARTGETRETPLAYFTDGEDVILIASNYGSTRHPAWYHNLVAHPDCELHIGPRGGHFIARVATESDRDRLYELVIDRLAPVFALHQQRSGVRSIPVMRLGSAA